ncbi:MAG: hypothetical protein K0R15_573 [Clostridiales bacterium]|jgi:thioredoxin reductase|nr:hypothetical protein [Clostridiales bacterium]
MYDIIIVGAGTAGLSAAIYGVRAGKNVLVYMVDRLSILLKLRIILVLNTYQDMNLRQISTNRQKNLVPKS